MHDICRDTNRCWAYPGQHVPPTPGCGERCGGHTKRRAAIADHYRQVVNDFHDNNPILKIEREYLKGGE